MIAWTCVKKNLHFPFVIRVILLGHRSNSKKPTLRQNQDSPEFIEGKNNYKL